MALSINIQRLLDNNPEYKITPRGVEKAVGGGKTELIVSIKGLIQDETTKEFNKADVVEPVVEEAAVAEVGTADEVVVGEAPVVKKSYYKKKGAA